ncbi:MAG: FAD-dependent oxidoreductase, partial [Gammaproteobacteria bacterium]|nr:FAD-dependent oxidoreductase [Gammaproteobacteria bacterium]
MKNGDYDIVVVGGGINGAGVAQAGAAAGYSVLLLEKEALASGTSSRSSKLIHGGLRYLESGEFGLVRESLCERRILLRNAPDLVRLQRFYLPVYKHTRRRPWQLRLGLSLYALLANLESTSHFTALPRERWCELDGLCTEGLQAVLCYQDGQTDDAALSRAVMRSAMSLGAELLVPAVFAGARLDEKGCTIHYHFNQHTHSCRTRVLVNAAGPWVNHVLRQIKPCPPLLSLELVQGTH